MSQPDSRLERRYARWIALFYPAGYRRQRGSELVDTYLSLAAPGRTRPAPADVADLAAGGLRQHLRTAAGLGPGLRLAGLAALTSTTAIAAWSASLELLAPRGVQFPLAALGMLVWVTWLLTAVASGRWFRRAAGLAVLATVGVVPAALLTGLPHPPLSVLVPQLALGIVAPAAARHHRWVRLTPLAAAAVTVPFAVAIGPRWNIYYITAEFVLPAAAVTLLLGATLLALGLAARRDDRGVWALLILLTPIGTLALIPIGAMLDAASPERPEIPHWPAMAAAATLVAAVGPALLLLAVAAWGRRSADGRPLPAGTAQCPTCGAPANSG